METITSRNNPLITKITALSDRKARVEGGLFCFEGRKLFLEALACGVEFERVFFTSEERELVSSSVSGGISCEVSPPVMEKLSAPFGNKTDFGIFSVAKALDKLHKNMVLYHNVGISPTESKNGILILSSLRDPGNMGTILRSAAAFGIGEIIISSDCVDIYNPKVVRSAMGALFRVSVAIVDDIVGTIGELRKSHRVWAAALTDEAKCIRELSLSDGRSAVVIGNEGSGLAPEVIAACDGAVIIPMEPGVESLNASVAASVFMWEMTK